MTLSGLKTVKSEIKSIKKMMPPESDDEDREFFYRFTSAEIDAMAEIFIKHKLAGDKPLENLTPEEVDFLAALLEKPIVQPPSIDKTKPRCHICGEQPAKSNHLMTLSNFVMIVSEH